MLVCSVSLRPPRAGITADIAEAAAALDDVGSGNIVFATLVDDPASVNETVDAYLGEIMLEAGNAADAADAGLSYAAAVVEAAIAADAQDAAAVGAVTAAIWDAATVTAVTLSGSNLVATNTGTTSADQGAHVAAASGKTAGKYYFEITWTAIASGAGSNSSIGVGTTASTYTAMGNGGTTGIVEYIGDSVYSNGANITGNLLGGPWSAGQVAGVAVDLDNRKIWFRKSPSGFWNSGVSGTNDPATNVGGLTIPAGTMVPFVTFGGSGGAASNVMTANFGASAFIGAVPSGFTSGWPP